MVQQQIRRSDYCRALLFWEAVHLRDVIQFFVFEKLLYRDPFLIQKLLLSMYTAPLLFDFVDKCESATFSV